VYADLSSRDGRPTGASSCCSAGPARCTGTARRTRTRLGRPTRTTCFIARSSGVGVPLGAGPEIWAPRRPDGPAGPVQEPVRRRVAAQREPSHGTHAVDGCGCTAWRGGAGAGPPAGTVLADEGSAGGRARLTCPTGPWIDVAASSVAARGGTPTSSSGANPVNPLTTHVASAALRFLSAGRTVVASPPAVPARPRYPSPRVGWPPRHPYWLRNNVEKVLLHV
jgi:hypothetical protein